MSIETPEVVEETQVLPDAPEPQPVVEIPEQRYEYQPTDASGRPIGGKQVIKYRTQEELVNQLQEQNVLILRKLREETRKNRLGITDDEPAATEAAPRFRQLIEFNERELTPEEQVQLSRDMLDPDQFNDAFDKVFEAKLGAKPAQLRAALKNQQDEHMRMIAKMETDAFLANNPQYFKCQENFEAITGWMRKRNLDPVRDNFQLAYDTLKAASVIIEPMEAPPTVEIEERQPEPAPAPAPAPTPEPARPRIASGLTKNQSSDHGSTFRAGDEITYEYVNQQTGEKKLLKGMKAINAMPSDEFKRRVNTEKGFSAKYEKLVNG